jgi:hypothetical protein
VRALIRLVHGGAAVAFVSSATAAPHVDLQPAVVTLGEPVTVVVSGWRPSHLEVALAGATTARGRLLGWRTAHRAGVAWAATLPRPALRGIYPVLLRARPASAVVRSPRWLLRIFRRAARGEPTFATPQAVVRWWVQTRPQGTVAALRRWRRSDFDKRDTRLHRLYVVAYNPPGKPGVANRLGMFVTVVRDGYSGRWRLLEATVQP